MHFNSLYSNKKTSGINQLLKKKNSKTKNNQKLLSKNSTILSQL